MQAPSVDLKADAQQGYPTFYFFFWSDAVKLYTDINFPIRKVAANIQAGNKLPKGKQPMKGEYHDPYDEMCIVL